MHDRQTKRHFTPRWVKVLALAAVGLALLLAVVMFSGIGGPHGPWRHLPTGASDGASGQGQPR